MSSFWHNPREHRASGIIPFDSVSRMFLFPIISSSRLRSLKEELLMCAIGGLPAGNTGCLHLAVAPDAYVTVSTVWEEWPTGKEHRSVISHTVRRGADNESTAHPLEGTLPTTAAKGRGVWPQYEWEMRRTFASSNLLLWLWNLDWR